LAAQEVQVNGRKREEWGWASPYLNVKNWNEEWGIFYWNGADVGRADPTPPKSRGTIPDHGEHAIPSIRIVGHQRLGRKIARGQPELDSQQRGKISFGGLTPLDVAAGGGGSSGGGSKREGGSREHSEGTPGKQTGRKNGRTGKKNESTVPEMNGRDHVTSGRANVAL